MSGIYGIFRFDGAPVEGETLRRMGHAMAYYGPDGGGEWHSGHVGLGQLQLNVTVEDRCNVQPMTAGGITMIVAARIYNRDELLREFGIPATEHPVTPDGQLVFEAYRKWGESCVDRLNGDWAFAAWDSREAKLSIARDQCGVTALFYYCNHNFMAFASSLKALHALPEVPYKPDLPRLAQTLFGWGGENFRTAYEGILRLPAAHVLRVTGNGVEKKRYWFPEQLQPIYFSRDDEYVEQFLEIYGQAVRVRLPSERPVGMTLSGGRDSSSVAAMAAPLMACENRTLTAFTSVPIFDLPDDLPYHITNEWPLAAATAQHVGNITHIPVRAENMGVIAGIARQLQIDDEPSLNAGNYYWINALMEQAKSLGTGVLLTGQGGNTTVSFAVTGQVIPHILKGDYRQALDALRCAEPNLRLALKRQIAKPLLLPLIRRFQQYRHSGNDSLINTSAINPGFANEILNCYEMKKARRDPRLNTLPLDRRRQYFGLGIISESQETWSQIGAWYGIEIRDPTFDRCMVEFCLSIPDHQYRQYGQGNRLFRRAMEGRLPWEVIDNGKSGLQGADLCQRIFSELTEVGLTLEKLEKNRLVRNYLDLPHMRKVTKELEQEITALTSDMCDDILLLGIAAGLYLSRF